jgi:hypothetical protein
MRDLIKPLLFMIGLSALLAALGWLCVRVAMPADGPGVGSEFGRGLDAGKAWCTPKKKCGKKLRKYLNEMDLLYGDWCEQYRGAVPKQSCLMRIWIESRGHPWSKTKDEQLMERGLTSVPWWLGKRLGGDPCGDPEWSICASMWLQNHRRAQMHSKKKWWSSWLVSAPRWDAEALTGACGSVNCQKLTLMAKSAGISEAKRPYWKLLSYWRENSSGLEKILTGKIKVSNWRFGFRLGRIVNALEHIVKDADGDYGWSEFRWLLPVCPVAKVAYVSKKDYGKACVSGKKARKKLWDPVHSWETGFEVWRAQMVGEGLLPASYSSNEISGKY